MNKYELMVILKESLKEAEAKSEIEVVKAKIAELGGTVTKEDIWGVKTFAFEMKKQLRGYYAVFEYDLEVGKTAEFSNFLKHKDAVMVRYLITGKE